MVRFDDIREVLRTTPEPIDACKLLTERANQAGGHDNITVIVVHFDGEGLHVCDPENDPLKYRKYALPEEPADNTEPHRRLMPELASPIPPEGPMLGPGSSAPQGLTSTVVYSGGNASSVPQAAPSFRPPARTSSRPPPSLEEERIDIPGTHVPAWIVVSLVVGVVVILAGTAFLLLR
jgi:protein phosphatase